jgi:hypothetical protein
MRRLFFTFSKACTQFKAEKKQADCPFEQRRRMIILQAAIRDKMRRLFFTFPKSCTQFKVEKKQADCPFEQRRRMIILQAAIRGKMRRLFFTVSLRLFRPQ